jgi:hypothetical protein
VTSSCANQRYRPKEQVGFRLSIPKLQTKPRLACCQALAPNYGGTGPCSAPTNSESSTQHANMVVVGTLHPAALFEALHWWWCTVHGPVTVHHHQSTWSTNIFARIVSHSNGLPLEAEQAVAKILTHAFSQMVCCGCRPSSSSGEAWATKPGNPGRFLQFGSSSDHSLDWPQGESAGP